MAKKKISGRDYPLSPTPEVTQDKGNKVITGSRPDIGVFKTEIEKTNTGGFADPYKYSRQSIDTSGYSKGKPNYKLRTEEGEGDKTGYRATKSSSKSISRKDVPSTLKSLKGKK